MRLSRYFCLICLLSNLFGCAEPADKASNHADLVVRDAMIWTADPAMPVAQALAVVGGKIIAVGSTAEIDSLTGPATQIINAPAGMVVPGFIDTHVHFLTGGFALSSVQLRNAASREIFTRRIADYAATPDPGDWIHYGDWDHENWGGELPTSAWIDSITPDNPVMINRLDGHMVLANSKALSLAGVSADTADVPGGEIVRDAQGNPTGIFKDNAMSLISKAVPTASPEQLDRALRSASAYVAAQGVTSVHDMADWESLATYRRARTVEGSTGKSLNTRIYLAVPLREHATLIEEMAVSGSGDEWLKIGGLKGFMDGSLGSHTAAFYEPFTDAPDDRGFFINDLNDMERWIAAGDAAGLHVMVHAIGDRAIGSLLDIYADVAEANGPRDRRFRIEHAQHIDPEDLQRFSELAVIASMQPYHAIDDGRWAERVIGGKRAKTTYAFNSLLESGAVLTFGSDWFVAPPVPLEGIYAAVTRRTLDDANPNGWVPEQKITVEQALFAYTRDAAYASFEEQIKGTLTPGKLADFVILDQNLLEIAAPDIRDVKVVRTVVGGKTVFLAD